MERDLSLHIRPQPAERPGGWLQSGNHPVGSSGGLIIPLSNQVTLMDANYVMDETLGTVSYDITKLRVGQTTTETFLIGKVSDVSPHRFSCCNFLSTVMQKKYFLLTSTLFPFST